MYIYTHTYILRRERAREKKKGRERGREREIEREGERMKKIKREFNIRLNLLSAFTQTIIL